MFRSSLVLAGVMVAALGLGGCAADGVPGPAGPAGEKGADGQDGVDGKNGVDGTNGVNGVDGTNGVNGVDGVDGKDGVDGQNMPGARTVTEFAANAMPIGSSASTALSAKISAPSKGKIIAIANMDAFCYAAECASSGQTMGNYWMSNQDNGALAAGQAYEYFWLAPQETENTSRTVVFDVAAAGDVTIKLQAQASNGTYSLYRRSLTLLFVPES